MVPAILILTFATALKNMTSTLGAKYFVGDLMSGQAEALGAFLPAIIFVVACVLAFATGTSWGTFGVLVPIAVTILGGSGTLTILTVSATLGGAVFGDHISPISDTTILASAGAQCNHVEHVNTQLPYASIVAGISVVAYLVAGATATLGSVLCCILTWVCALAVFAGVVFLLRYLESKKPVETATEQEQA